MILGIDEKIFDIVLMFSEMKTDQKEPILKIIFLIFKILLVCF